MQRKEMKFSDINFTQSGRFDRPGLGLKLPGGFWVQQKYFETAWQRALENIPKLDWRHLQTAETLCGTKCWRDHDCGPRLKLGRCIKYFVVQQMLPLRVANARKKGARKYTRQ